MIEGYTTTQYTCECDFCGDGEVCPDSVTENVHTKQQARKWAGLHLVKINNIYYDLCDSCYKKYKNGEIKI